MKKVLIVDDEQSILTLLEYNLVQAGYDVVTAMDGKTAYKLIKKGQFDFIILDIMLPGMDGMDVCRRVRQDRINTPILMLTAKDDEYDKIIGLELGADDYMTKPFSPREVLARIKAIFRRTDVEVDLDGSHSSSSDTKEETAHKFSNTDDGDDVEVIRIGELEIYSDRYEVRVADKEIEVTPKEFELLLYMATRKGRILSRDQLLNRIWNFDYAGETRIVDVHISHLREKIEKDTKNPEYIKTVRGFGYKFEVPEE